MKIYAHRAGRGLAPENTLFACENVLGLGIDFIDLDVVFTKDGEIAVCHDPMLNPDITRDASGCYIQKEVSVHTLTFQELQVYNVGTINQTSSYAKFFPMQKQLDHAHIPSLCEAIEHVENLSGKKIGFQIEMKTQGTHLKEFSKTLYSILKKYQLIERVEVQSFDYSCLQELQTLDSTIQTAYLTYPGEIDLLPAIKSLGGSIWGPYQMDVTEKLVEEAHKAGLKIVPWGYPELEGTEFNEAQIKKLISWNVDGIITDRPDMLKLINRLTK